MAAIYRRGQTWWGRAQRDGQEFRRSLKTKDRREAQRIFAGWIAEIERVQRGGKPNRTFDELVEHFLAEHMPTLRPASQRRYVVSIRHLLAQFGGKGVDQITGGALADFESMRRHSGARPPTIRRDLSCLSSIFSCGVEWEWIEVNPVPAYMKRRAKRGLKEAAPRTRWLTHDEERRLLSAASPAVRDAIAVAIDTGLRREEQFGLKRAQVSLARGEIQLTTNTKTARSRVVPILPRAGTILGTLLAVPTMRSEWVFHHDKGRRYLQMNKGLKAAARRAGIKDVRWHDLRRTCGCRLLQDRGLSLDKVRDWLGHSSVVTTEKAYAFLTIDDLHRAVGTGTISGTGERAS